MIETTDDHFQFFINSVEYYCDKLKVSGWDIRFQHKFVENGFVSVRTDDINRIAEFWLTTEWKDEVFGVTDERLDYCARHEVAHLFMRRVFALAESRYVLESQIDTLDEEYAIRIAELIDQLPPRECGSLQLSSTSIRR